MAEIEISRLRGPKLMSCIMERNENFMEDAAEIFRKKKMVI